ncbi:hypothetical protein QR680_018166 [Steinernema hermaphroditum]|uniref:G-protein coupled receptors family 1 profile domain-containing protein n=1 Tax=Steinernema hermaphroditum TaxID=289476 RepID=A0AA39HI05_9BILA|nr:hypothetical protein QR680_018166 [Steinernema hermaphroditum]
MLPLNALMIVYIVEGAFVLIVNIPSIFVIYSVSRLSRSKDIIALGGLCLADISHSLAFFVAGIMRKHKIDIGLEHELVEQWTCYFVAFDIMFFVGYQFTGLMTMVVSLDRLLAVTCPLMHATLRTRHYLLMIGLQLVYCVAIYFIALPFQMSSTLLVSGLCFTSTGFYRPIWSYLLSFRIITIGTSVLLYVPIVWKTRKLLAGSKKPAVASRFNVKKQRLARLNVTIGLASISGLVLLFVPDILILFDLFGVAAFDVIFYIIALNKCVVNVFFFTFRHRELRTAFMRPFLKHFGHELSHVAKVKMSKHVECP